MDLDESKMDDGLKWFRLLDDYSEIKSYCVVAGGDGTVGKLVCNCPNLIYNFPNLIFN